MKNKIYLKLMVVFLLMGISTVSVLAEDSGFVTPNQKNNLYNAIDNYYLTFSAENMDDYLNTQYLGHLSSEELIAKKKLIREMWDAYSSDYSLSERDNCTYTVEDSMAIVEYTLSTRILDNNYNELDSFDVDMTAILFDTKNGWKIFNTVPTSVFEFNTAVDLFGNVNDSKDEELIEENSSKAEINTSKNNKSIACDIDFNLTFDSDFVFDNSTLINSLIGNDKNIMLKIGDSLDVYYHFNSGHLKLIPETEDIDYFISMDSCTLQRLVQGSSPRLEYRNGNIRVEGKKISSTFKITLGKLLFKVYSWFAPPPPTEIWIEAETADLKNKGKYSYVGPTSRGPGELYLGDKGAVAEYEFNLKQDGVVYLYARVSDDGLHRDGARSVVFNIDGEDVKYESKSHNYMIDGKFWGWVYIGKFDVTSGKHTFTITKPTQTSAAFIADKFVLFDKKRDISSFG